MTTILAEAEALISGDRAEEYGDAGRNFATVWHLWQPVLASDMPGPAKVALCLAQIKVARLCNTPGHRDSWVDLAGYAALGGRVMTEPPR